MQLSFTFDRTLSGLRKASMLSSQPGIDQLPGSLALEHKSEMAVISGDVFLLTRELLDGLSKMLTGRTPKLTLIGESEQWEIARLSGWISIRAEETRGLGDGETRRLTAKVRAPRVRLARAVLRGVSELLVQLFAINNQLEMLPAVAEIRKAHQQLTEAIESIGAEPVSKKLERLRNDLQADRWKAATVALGVLVLLQSFVTMNALRALKREQAAALALAQATPTVSSKNEQESTDDKRASQSGTSGDGSPAMGPPSPSLLGGMSLGMMPSPNKLKPLPIDMGAQAAPQLPPATITPNPVKPPPLPRLVGTIETSVSSAAMFEDGNTVEVYAVGAEVPGGWLVTKVENGTVSLAHGEGKSRILAQVSMPALSKPPAPLTIPAPRAGGRPDAGWGDPSAALRGDGVTRAKDWQDGRLFILRPCAFALNAQQLLPFSRRFA